MTYRTIIDMLHWDFCRSPFRVSFVFVVGIAASTIVLLVWLINDREWNLSLVTMLKPRWRVFFCGERERDSLPWAFLSWHDSFWGSAVYAANPSVLASFPLNLYFYLFLSLFRCFCCLTSFLVRSNQMIDASLSNKCRGNKSTYFYCLLWNHRESFFTYACLFFLSVNC